MHLKSGFEFKVRILDLAIEREMQNGFHPHHLRNPSPNFDFMDFLCTFLVGKAKKAKKKKNTVHKNSVFFSACYVCACETTVLSKTVQIFFSYPRKKKKEETKKGKPSTGLSSLKSVFRLASFDSNFKTPSPDFPIAYAGLLSLEVSGELPWQ